MDRIILKGVRTHNLKNIDLEIPKNKMVVITGISGSGKSSLAFDTIYAEGQRRYIESLSAYARQFLEMMEKPDVDLIEGLSPSIAVSQHNPVKNPRSTVGTTTEIYDYLRLLFARIGKPHCPQCHRELKSQTPDFIIDDIKKRFTSKDITIKIPLVIGRTGTYEELFNRYNKKGFTSFEIDGKNYNFNNLPSLERYKKHNIYIILDKFKLLEDEYERLSEDIDLALNEADFVEINHKNDPVIYSKKNICPYCQISIAEIEPRLFSFNSPYGACPKCEGIGFVIEVDETLVIDYEKTIEEGAIICFEDPVTTRTNRWKNSWRNYYRDIIYKFCEKYNIPVDKKFKHLSKEHKKLILYGDEEFEGVINNIKRRYKETESDFVKLEIQQRFMKELKCDLCNGKRLKNEALYILINGKNIWEVSEMTISELKDFIDNLNLSKTETEIAKLILKEIKSRISFLLNVGLGYLTLSRYSHTLSGGESQRISLASFIGTRLSGVVYVLDEPTIGLHPVDNQRLIDTLKSLRDLGNTLIIVEHDEKMITNADHLIELGPGAGIYGGNLVFNGSLEEMKKDKNSITGKYLTGELKVYQKRKERKLENGFIFIKGAKQFNLKNIDVKIPLKAKTVICGVSGSGKSTLLYEIIYKGIMKKINPFFKEDPGSFKEITIDDNISGVILLDQSPIGKTSRSNPATYVGFFDEIRNLFSMTPQARRKGYSPSRFSFNLSGGRCENCKGEGYLNIQMQFMPDVHIKCDECDGKRFNKDTLEVKYKDKNIYEVLEMSVEEAMEFFKDIPRISNRLNLLYNVGLGYIKIGQSSTTLSGGEAQRIKIAYELSKRSRTNNIYLLDEPTTGLHFNDVSKLLNVLDKLVEKGNTVIIIEHNIDVIKFADWIIELGPGGGPDGGLLIYQGKLEDFKKCKKSITSKYIK